MGYALHELTLMVNAIAYAKDTLTMAEQHGRIQGTAIGISVMALVMLVILGKGML